MMFEINTDLFTLFDKLRVQYTGSLFRETIWQNIRMIVKLSEEHKFDLADIIIPILSDSRYPTQFECHGTNKIIRNRRNTN